MSRGILIRGGQVIDGSGAPGIMADLRVRNGVITEFAPELSATDDEEILEASGRQVLPGFVDVHAHDDAALFRSGAMEPKLSQGVTTTVIGNCGHGCAPSAAGAALEEYATPILGPFPKQRYATFADYMADLDRAHLDSDVVSLVPHAPLRSAVLGMERRAADAREIQQICGLLDEGLAAGAAGLSLGLMYSPGSAANRQELVEMARVVAARGRVLVAHIRNEAAGLQDSLEEVLSLGRQTGCALHISHLKVTGPENFGTVPRMLNLLDVARAEGVDVTVDVYPYAAGSTTAATLFPSWSTDRGTASLLEVLADSSARRRTLDELRRPWDGEVENYFSSIGPEAILLAGFEAKELQHYEGQSLAQISHDRGKDPGECLAELMIKERAGLTALLFHTDPRGVEEALAWPHTLIGSDGLPRENGYIHPRLFGAFPRVLSRFAGPGKSLTRLDAIRRMTSASAERFGAGTGILQPGARANLQIIDPESYCDRADYNSPRKKTAGLDGVLLGGERVWPPGRVRYGSGTRHRVERVGQSV